MSAKIKTKLQKLSRFQEYFSEVEVPPQKKVKTNDKPPKNLVTKPPQTPIPEPKHQKEPIKEAIEEIDEKDNQIVKLDVEALNNISKVDGNEEKPTIEQSKCPFKTFSLNESFKRFNLFLE